MEEAVAACKAGEWDRAVQKFTTVRSMRACRIIASSQLAIRDESSCVQFSYPVGRYTFLLSYLNLTFR